MPGGRVIPLVTGAEMRALDAAVIDELGLPGVVMMEAAGRAVTAAVLRARAEHPGPVAVVCGGGNNGGDGFVVARALLAAGVPTRPVVVAPPSAIGGDALLHLTVLERSGAIVADASKDLAPLAAALDGAAIVVDAVFGTGLGRPITGHLAEVIAAINHSGAHVIAIDLPSGVDADTGATHGIAVRAHRTITLGTPKIGIVSAPGFASAGAVEIVDIGVPVARARAIATAGQLEERDVREALPLVGRLDYKGARGHVLVVGGSPGRRGAGRLAARGALRAGAGLCTLAGPPPGDGELTADDSIMTRVIEDGAALVAAAAGMDAMVIGPGMPGGEAGRAWMDAVLADDAPPVPVVVDATGLSHLVGRAGPIAEPGRDVVITPHPGEAARLLDTTADAVERDRLGAARALAAATGAVVVLKGARTLICAGDHVAINPTGGPALATAGSGDVLAGVIAALLAQEVSAVAAARLAVWIHGRAGDALGAHWGERGAIATDLPDAIALALRDLAASVPA